VAAAANNQQQQQQQDAAAAERELKRGGACTPVEASRLLQLPVETLETILASCDVASLLSLDQTCATLHAFDAQAGLRLVHKLAKQAVQAAAGDAERWR
jgi:hypothetical protein